MTAKTNILFPIETTNRELDFKLFLAAMYARPDNRIFIGQHDLLHNTLLSSLQGGIYLGKNLFMSHFPTSIHRYEELKKRGFNVVHLDEEGGIYQGDDAASWERMLNLRLDIKVLDENDRVCTWGDFQTDHYAQLRPGFRENLQTTGHPRFDLYKPRFRNFFHQSIDNIKERFGDFILVNTNLTLANNVFGVDETFSGYMGYSPQPVEQRLSFVERWRHTNHTLANFVLLVHKLAIAFPETNFVLRPHPSENWDYYKHVFKGVENVHVVHEGPVGSWIMASKALIHDGCTTAVEAFLAEKPVINFKSLDNPKYEYYLPNSLKTLRGKTVDEVMEAVGQVMNGNYQTSTIEIPEQASRLFHNFISDKGFEEVARQMQMAEEKITLSLHTPSLSNLNMISYKEQGIEAAKKLVRPLFPDKMLRYKSGRNQFHGFSKEILARKMKYIQEDLNKAVNYRLFGENLIVIESA